jgi:hypothetical protein
LISAAFACPADFKPAQEHLDAHFRSLAFLQNHESGVLRAVPIEPDLHSIMQMVKSRSQEVRKLEDLFENRKLPMGFFAVRVGYSIFHLWRILLGHNKLRMRFAFGNAEEQEVELSSARGTDSISVDLFALFTLQHLKILHLLPKLFRRIYAHTSVLDTVVADTYQN